MSHRAKLALFARGDVLSRRVRCVQRADAKKKEKKGRKNTTPKFRNSSLRQKRNVLSAIYRSVAESEIDLIDHLGESKNGTTREYSFTRNAINDLRNNCSAVVAKEK